MKPVSWTKQSALALSLFTLGMFAYWLEFKHKPEKEHVEEQQKKIFHLSDQSVQSLDLFDGTSYVTLSCTSDASGQCKPGDHSNWEIKHPIEVKADSGNVNSLLMGLQNLDSTETITLKEESSEKKMALLKEYGLDHASRKTNRRVEITVGGKKTSLSIGLTHPIGSSFFVVRLDDGAQEDSQIETVYLLPSYFKSHLEHDLSYWREKKLLTLGSHEIARFDLEGKQVIHGERQEGKWVLSQAEGAVAGDSEAIDKFLNAATHLTAKSFISDDKNDLPSKKLLADCTPVAKIKLHKEKDPKTEKELDPAVIQLFEKKKPLSKGAQISAPTLYVILSGAKGLYEVESTLKEQLLRQVSDLRMGKLITTMDQFTTRKIHLSGGPFTPPMILSHEGGKWVNEAKEEVAADKVQALLEKLAKEKAQNFLKDSSHPTQASQVIEFSLENDKGEVKRKLGFWKHEERVYAKDLLSQKGETLDFGKAFLSIFPWEKDFFKKTLNSKADSETSS